MATEPNLSPPTDNEAPERTEPAQETDSGPPEAPASAVSRPGAEGDVIVDIPQLAVDELNLELHAPILDQVKLEAKALQVGLFAKVDLDNVIRLVGKRPAPRLPTIEGRETRGGEQEPRAEDDERAEDEEDAKDEERAAAAEQRTAEVREELQHLLESAKGAYEEVSDRNLEEQVRQFYDTARDVYARMSGGSGDDGDGGDSGDNDGDRRERGGQRGHESWAESVGRRALELTRQGGKAAGLTAAGVAGGAALESVRHSGGLRLQSPIQRRSSNSLPKAVIHTVRDRIG